MLGADESDAVLVAKGAAAPAAPTTVVCAPAYAANFAAQRLRTDDQGHAP